jgi:hypothetical protein
MGRQNPGHRDHAARPEGESGRLLHGAGVELLHRGDRTLPPIFPEPLLPHPERKQLQGEGGGGERVPAEESDHPVGEEQAIARPGQHALQVQTQDHPQENIRRQEEEPERRPEAGAVPTLPGPDVRAADPGARDAEAEEIWCRQCEHGTLRNPTTRSTRPASSARSLRQVDRGSRSAKGPRSAELPPEAKDHEAHHPTSARWKCSPSAAPGSRATRSEVFVETDEKRRGGEDQMGMASEA